jgi:hypothetical protein
MQSFAMSYKPYRGGWVARTLGNKGSIVGCIAKRAGRFVAVVPSYTRKEFAESVKAFADSRNAQLG